MQVPPFGLFQTKADVPNIPEGLSVSLNLRSNEIISLFYVVAVKYKWGNLVVYFKQTDSKIVPFVRFQDARRLSSEKLKNFIGNLTLYVSSNVLN